jgi:hypothetical protein
VSDDLGVFPERTSPNGTPNLESHRFGKTAWKNVDLKEKEGIFLFSIISGEKKGHNSSPRF